MRYLFVALVVLVALTLIGCASKPPATDPRCTQDPPSIGATEPLKDYTLRIVSLYKLCVQGVDIKKGKQ